ncbi:MAG: type II toxin-antitoxin system RelE/ParE family toxin, partial [Planctomycetota bacterium]
KFLDELQIAVNEIGKNPRAFPPHNFLDGVRSIKLRSLPFRLYFQAAEGGILVYAIYHASREPDAWADRLSESS